MTRPPRKSWPPLGRPLDAYVLLAWTRLETWVGSRWRGDPPNDERLRWHQRQPWLEALHTAVDASFGTAGGWAPSEDDLELP